MEQNSPLLQRGCKQLLPSKEHSMELGEEGTFTCLSQVLKLRGSVNCVGGKPSLAVTGWPGASTLQSSSPKAIIPVCSWAQHRTNLNWGRSSQIFNQHSSKQSHPKKAYAASGRMTNIHHAVILIFSSDFCDFTNSKSWMVFEKA